MEGDLVYFIDRYGPLKIVAGTILDDDGFNYILATDLGKVSIDKEEVFDEFEEAENFAGFVSDLDPESMLLVEEFDERELELSWGG